MWRLALFAVGLVFLLGIALWQTIALIRAVRGYWRQPVPSDVADSRASQLLTDAGNIRSFFRNKCMTTSNRADGPNMLEPEFDEWRNGSDDRSRRVCRLPVQT
jgi:hypothetical protein